MSGRLQEVTARIGNVRELGGIVDSMRNLATVRVQQARRAAVAVETYAETIEDALLRIAPLLPADRPLPASKQAGSAGAVVFCAEQGFAGLFSEHVLDALRDDEKEHVFLIGTRGNAIARVRGLAPKWTAPAVQNPGAVPELADSITKEIGRQVVLGHLVRVTIIVCQSSEQEKARVIRLPLFPFDPAALGKSEGCAAPPLLNVAPEKLMPELVSDYMFSQLCLAALQSFKAENQARSERMTAAHHEITRQLKSLEQLQRTVRQEEITSEIIELVSGPTLAKLKRFNRHSRA
ncbi:F0F1 ATP synthase subunit gamma [Gluconobacter roseus]|uniref:F0F1 ATP synthase subunit gamma n=1 Tax=Gluconobacter roseus TaxID=586239 RepID=UPI0038D13446